MSVLVDKKRKTTEGTMGSPWPWSQEPVKANSGSSITSIQTHDNNNNHNKRMNYGYEYSYYNNHHNHDYHHPAHHHHHHHHQQQPHPNQRYIPSPSPPPVQQIISNDVGRLRSSYPFYGTNGVQLTNNNVSTRKPSGQSQFVTFVKEVPTWSIYFSDQKHRIIDFTDKNNSIRPDSFINQLVSLCFVDTCITNLAVDAIVNSTTQDYCGVAGVDKLIHQQAGRNLREACKSLPRLGPGQAEMTLGFSLPAQYIIHTNGPLTEDAEQLTGCYVNSFNLLLMHRLRTIAFPCISTGKKGLSKKFAAEIALRTVRHFLEEHKQEVDRVIFCLHHQKDIEIYLRYMQIYFPVVDPEFRITT
ncbi:O-acetyl-ADP-ribose deacetylase MACROD1 [Orchesella cincta]|uniref:O-acetyl-ADP-ribose deacetylase MACROD1 n=1 Tax=Orchesella cincta TaxID=48709 RepID=A0A1D2MZI2_ORCCI|nr:O-acetyl-ADP-ribose deacetylase MACROD1 [Orchesella cincta]